MNINQIAKLAGVSKRSITRALNGQAGLSDKTRKRILSLAEKHNYRPSIIARALNTRRTHTLALIIPENENMFFAGLTRAVEETANLHGFSIVLMNTYLKPEKELDCLKLCKEKLIDGILITPAATENDRTLKLLEKLEIPFVLMNRRYEGTDKLDYVVNDNRHGAILAVTHLLEHGYRKIGMVNSHITASSSKQRRRGYLEALAKYQVKPEAKWNIQVTPTIAGGGKAAGMLLAQNALPEALFAFNDLIAAGMYQVFKKRGVIPGRDIFVIGYDDIELAACLEPPLTTIFQPRHEIGRTATEMLINKLKTKSGGGSSKWQHQIFTPALVVRASCGCSIE